MRRLYMASIAALVAGFAPFSESAAQTPPTAATAPAVLRIAVVNTQRLQAEAPPLVQVRQQLEREAAAFRTEMDTTYRSLQRADSALERQRTTLSPVAYQQQQQALQNRAQRLEQRQQEIQRRLQQRENELGQTALIRIRSTIEQVRREGNYTLVYDSQAAGILATDPALDVTEQVLTRLRATGAPATPPVR